ncbi:TRRAP [Lepeophtheirus salmonis]|uniref:TRRAP n=1 Tax=Lepeophtheirus salmonis TaxID=72036 RepID=A0A7R8H5N4_LEPSM|nr:TRRAP [Lepeophtheirus salmonis]CAF2880898.1 TRRAP [Lepeophtheirus salmonis]
MAESPPTKVPKVLSFYKTPCILPSGTFKVKCKYCDKEISGSRLVTTNWWKHLRKVHAGFVRSTQEKDPKNQVAPLTLNPSQPRKKYDSKSPIQNKATEKLVDFLTHDVIPLSIVESTNFQSFVSTLDPQYVLPSRKHLSTTLLKNKYEKIKNGVMIKLRDTDSLCLTIDIWSNRQIQSFLGLTAHYISSQWTFESVMLRCKRVIGPHISENITLWYEETVSDFDIGHKVKYIITDSALNMKKAFREIRLADFDDEDNGLFNYDCDTEEEYYKEEFDINVEMGNNIADIPFPQHVCFAHTLQLVVKDGFMIDEKEEDYVPGRNHMANKEVKDYLESVTLEMIDNPAEFWRSNSKKYPLLSKLAKEFLGIPSSSAPVERLFSVAGNIFRVERCQLTDARFEQLIFIRYTFEKGSGSTSRKVINSQTNVEMTSMEELFRAHATVLRDPLAKDEAKLKAVQELSERLEDHPEVFVKEALGVLLGLLKDGTPHFIAEYNVQQVRKTALECLQRLPADALKPHFKNLLMFKLLESENEENVLVILRIIIELHKQFRPLHSLEITQFLQLVKSIYKELPNHLAKIFEPRDPIKVKDLSELNIEALLGETFTVTTITTEKKAPDGASHVSYNLIPKAVLQELPIIVVLMYQLYKQFVHQEVAEFIPLIMNTITLQPSLQVRSHRKFNKEVFVDFMGAQIKTLSFLAYIIRIYLKVVSSHSAQMVKGMLSLLAICPHEVAHLRKELLIAARHILATDLRTKFVPHMEELFDENILLGKGWTTHESLRPLAYSTLADLVHHVRQQIPLSDLSRAVQLFSLNVHDESLPTSIQTMSCKLLLNLVECIRSRSDQEQSGGNGRELLMKMMEHKAAISASNSNNNNNVSSSSSQGSTSNSSAGSSATSNNGNSTPAGHSAPSTPDINVKTEDIKPPLTPASTYETNKLPTTSTEDELTKKCKFGFPPSQANNYTVADCRGLVKTLVCATTTTSTSSASGGGPSSRSPAVQPSQQQQQQSQQQQSQQQQQTVRTKEEKEVLEHFAGVFSLLNPQTFKEVFSQTIDFVVERIYDNYALQIMANSFLANNVTSPIFATILVEYLLQRMHEMGSNMDRSNLYLKLFKLVFGSVSLFAAENEQMLRPHLHSIVNKSMELAKSAKEPYNYFLLLRALFRSIGGGSHDLLYQEFLPLLPNLLMGLNSLQSGLHKQHMKDLFVELCLTVPVRLSSLLPYLPMLMDPLVSALNGSQTLVSQGLRTLELCVDNLQPDFLYEHIQPVRAELMQALWRTLRNPSDQIAHVAFRVLGKFGGVQKIIETAFNALKSSNTEPGFYRKQCWEVIKCYLVSSLVVDDDKATLLKLLSHPEFREGPIGSISVPYYKCGDPQARKVHQMAVTGMFVAAAIKELRQSVLPTMVALVRHYTIVAIAQQAGPFPMSTKQNKLQGMDPLVLIDALAVIMGHEEKELCKPGHLAMVLILDTAVNILGGKERACRLPLMEYLADRMCNLCYERAWYAKLGGCIAIKFLFERMDLLWVFQHQFSFLKALLFVMMDLTDEVSSGAVDMAKSNLEKMLTLCASPIEIPLNVTEPRRHQLMELQAIQTKSLHDVIHELVRQVTSPNIYVREHTMSSLQLLSKIQTKPITEIMEPHKDVLSDMIPPKKHLLRHQPVNAQIGLMDGNTFCTTLEPRLFTIDLKIVEHKVFFTELLSLCENDDQSLQKLPCYKTISNLVPLRKSALKALAACHYIPECREKIFAVLYKALNSTNNELVDAGYECMKKFITGFQIDMDMANTVLRTLSSLQDYRNITINLIKRLCYLARLFPSVFVDNLTEQLLQQQLKKWLEMAIVGYKNPSAAQNVANKVGVSSIGNSGVNFPPTRTIEMLCKLVLTTERALLIEPETSAKDAQIRRYLEFIVNHEDGGVFRNALMTTKIDKLIAMASGQSTSNNQLVQLGLHQPPALSPHEKSEIQFGSVCLTYVLVKRDSNWLKDQHNLVNAFKNIWNQDKYHEKHKKGDVEILLLFQLLRALCGRYLADFQFLKDFLETEVCSKYSISWKRAAFFEFVRLWKIPGEGCLSQELKARILQFIIIPSFAFTFDKGDGDALIGSPPAPDQECAENVVSTFIMDIIDPDIPFGTSDTVRILLLQFSCLLVDQGSAHIHDAANKRQGNKLRRLMTYAWPCLLSKNCVDPATRYHGHLLLSHIIAKFAIHKRIVLQVFHSLLKAHAVEARQVVRQALEILTPSMPGRMEDGNTMLTHWTKKIIVEDGHTGSQLVHILQLVVKHYKVYYPVRHHLIQHVVTSIQRLGFTATATIEQKRLAVDLCEIAIKWEMHRVKEEGGSPDPKKMKLPSMKSVASPSSTTSSKSDAHKPLDKVHSDAIVNYLLRLACQVSDTQAATGTSPGEILSRRCVTLLKMALKPDVWPNLDLKLHAFEKILTGPLGVDSGQPNYINICTCLDILSFLLTILRKDQILVAFKPLQKAIATCTTCPNSKVIRAVHSLMSRLMNLFPTEPTNSSVGSKYEELEQLYAMVGKVVYEGLANYEKNPQAPPSSLFGTLMMLKAACINNSCYVDRLISSFMRVLQRMAREHLNPVSNESTAAASCELLILSLDLVKNRVAVMGHDMRKAFIGTILVGLIEKSLDVKVMKAITKMLEDWIKHKDLKMLNQGPTLKEKSILLVKMMQYVEKRFPDDTDLNAQFLELINYVYRDESLKGTELTSKLEPAFLSGLRMKRRLYDRLLYVICSQNWDSMGPHYWIKQAIALVMTTATPGTPIQNCTPSSHLPSVTSVIALAEPCDRNAFHKDEDLAEIELSNSSSSDGLKKEDPSGTNSNSNSLTSTNNRSSLFQLISRQFKFLESIKEVKTVHFLNAASQLCHMDHNLAEDIWLNFFPRVWSVLADKQREALAQEIIPFICSGAHVIQKDCQLSALNTFVEALSRCKPSIAIKPALIKYLAKSHNLWHRGTLMLESIAFDGLSSPIIKPRKELSNSDYEIEANSTTSLTLHQEATDALSEMYSLLKEEDMWAGLWQKKAKYTETNIAIAYEQQGYFEQAQGAFELAMTKYRNDYGMTPSPVSISQEVRLWEDHWLRSSKELNQWELLLEYGNLKGINNPLLVLESAWRVPNWQLMKESLNQVEVANPKEMAWKNEYVPCVERCVEMASSLCMREWRRLPQIVSHIHLPYLQAAQQVMELHEAAQIHQGLLHGRTNSLHDMKAIVKTWRNRLPVISDDLSHWSEIFTWRQHHYQYIALHYSSENQQAQHQDSSNSGASTTTNNNNSMLGVHASAQAIIHFGKIARKHNLTGVCLESLSRIYTIASVPIVDCFQKIRQQVKCYVQTAVTLGRNELQEGLEVIESTNLKYFTKDMTAEFYALKGMLLAQIGRSEDANKAFSASVQMHDTLVKAWALWGDYLEQLFTRDGVNTVSGTPRNVKFGVEAITCYLHACRHQNESKSRKYLAKVLWLLTYDNDKLELAEAVDKYNVGVPPIQWLPWIPQLLTCLVRSEGKLILNLLSTVGRMFPQAVYFPIRTLYLTLKIEQRERFKTGELASERRSSESPGDQQQQQQQQQANSESGPIRATAPMWRCSRIMHMQRDLHPTVLSSLEGIVDQMVWFRENWYEEVLRQLRQGLAKCYAIAFDHRGEVSDATITPHTLNFVKKLVSTFGIGIENFSSSVTGNYSSAASESLVRRAQATAQDPVFQRMKSQFTSDFDFAVPGSMKLQNLISKLKKWISILEAKTKILPKSFLIEEKCRFLSNFSRQTAEVELPGELLLPKHSHYQVCIQRFMPRVEIVQKHNSAARRLYIRGHNGKNYPYLVINDSGLADARREERVLQLLRMMNHLLGKHKETSRRFLNFTVPRVVAVSPQMRLVQDNASSISILDIYKRRCAKRALDHDNPIARYYERLTAVQARGSQASHQVLREILKEVQSSMVPRNMFKEWAVTTFSSATDYWTFRKMLILQLALASFAEYVLHLSRLNPDMMYIHQDSGLVNVSYFKFDVDDATGDLDSTRPVPFRLTPNISEFLTQIGVCGPLTAAMISTARCFVHPSYKIQAILRAVLRDEMIAWNKKNNHGVTTDLSGDRGNLDANGQLENKDSETIINMVNRAVSAITQRLGSLSAFDGTDSKVSTLVAAANSMDNLCRMDPAWHPWL